MRKCEKDSKDKSHQSKEKTETGVIRNDTLLA